MSFWTFAFLCVIAGIVYDLVRKGKIDLRGLTGSDERALPRSPAREAELVRELEQLRERVKVLERIATEDREAKRLSEDIERLRDQG